MYATILFFPFHFRNHGLAATAKGQGHPRGGAVGKIGT